MESSWSFEEASLFIVKAEPIASYCGFLVGIYGSVARSRSGRDLDLLIVPKRPYYDIEACVRYWCRELALTEIGEPYTGMMDTQAYLLKDERGKLIDAQFQQNRTKVQNWVPWD